MFSRIRARLSFSKVTSVIALFVALGGTAYAVHNFTGADIQDESLTGHDVKGADGSQTVKGTNGSLTGADISGQKAIPAVGQAAVNGSLNTYDLQDGGVRGVDLQADTLTGGQINESTLGQVPSAAHADGAGYADYAGYAYDAHASSLTDPEGWHYIGDPGEPVFESGWHNYDAATSHNSAQYPHASFMRDKEGVVHLRGLVAGGGINQVMFRLPGQDCPWFYHAFGTISNNAFAR